MGLTLILALLAAPQAQARYASIVIDSDTGEVLHETNADTRNHPASLTKMMTLYLTFEALENGDFFLKKELSVSRRAAGMPASKLGLTRRDKITVEQAILALVTKSANDVAVVLAEALADKETKFAKVMTKKARSLGMKRTNFRNASGLPNRGQLSTARDMAILAQALLRNFPQYYDYFSTKQFDYKGQVYRNHNRLLKQYKGADGIKTGYIRASGFNLVASATRNGQRLIAVVFGGKSPKSRDRQVAKLLNSGFTRLAANDPAGIENIPGVPPRKPVFALAATTDNGESEDTTMMEMAAAEIIPSEIGSAEDTTPDENWGVQVGAYYRYNPAQRAANKAAKQFPELLGQSRVMITHIKGRRGRIYRARLIGLSELSARKACVRLASAKVDCLVVLINTTVASKSDRRLAAAN